MLEIFFPTNKGIRSTKIDEETYALVRDFKLTLDADGYVDCLHNTLPNGHKRLHKILLPSELVDHKNRIRTDNRIENLRAATISQNCTNKSGNLFGNPSSKYRGVSLYKRTDLKTSFKGRTKWRCGIKKEGKYINKKFDFEIEAAIHYDKLAKELHGEFANLNFPDNESLMQACIDLAAQKVDYYKKTLAPSDVFGSDVPRNGGSYGTPRPEKTGQVLQAYAQYLPSVLQATNSQAVPTAQANLAADQATAGGEAQLNTDLTRQYAPQLAAVNSQIQDQQTQAGSQTVAKQLNGAGGAAADAARNLLARDNPEFAKTIGASATKSQDLLNSYNLNGLSPGEANAVERSTNQSNSGTGNLGLANPTNVISNAMNFGQAFDAKRAALNTAIGTGNQTASTAIGAFNPLNVATMQPSTSGLTQFNQSQTGTNGAQSALQFGQGVMGNQFGSNNAAIGAAASRANANSVPSYLGAMPSYS